MTDTLWADVSQFQPSPSGDSYPFRIISFRSNDGTYNDTHFVTTKAWAEHEIASGRLDAYIVYAVYEPDNGVWGDRLMQRVGKPHPRMLVMMDVESWNGRIKGNQSRSINASRAKLGAWLGTTKRVLGYGNLSDLANLWPDRGDVRLVVAAIGFNPSLPGKIAHQFSWTANVPPFGHGVDMNSADGLSVAQFLHECGIDLPAPKPPVASPTPPKPIPVPKPPAPAPKPPKPAPKPPVVHVPAFPLKPTQYFGPRRPLWNLKSVSGYFTHRADLKVWQAEARKNGFYLGPIDGHYTEATARAAEVVQKHFKMKVDRLIGPNTWRAVWRTE